MNPPDENSSGKTPGHVISCPVGRGIEIRAMAAPWAAGAGKLFGETMTTKHRKECTAHHRACDCREAELRHKTKLWNLIHSYVKVCGGDPSKHVYGNTLRQKLVVEIERAALPDRDREAEIRALLEEVIRIHADPDAPEFSKCDIEPCMWCERAKKLLEE